MGVALRTYVHNYYSKVVAMRARSLDIREKIIKFHLEKMAPFVSRCKSHGLLCLVHSRNEGLQEKLFICQGFNQKFTTRMEKNLS